MIVYHLSKAKWALDNIRNKRIKIAEINDLNDPFELSGPDLRDKKERKEFNSWRDTMAQMYGVVCFSRSWSNPVLWSHYADKHAGIALGFEVPPDAYLNDVIYTSTRLTRSSLAEINGPNANEYMRKLLCTKYTDWAYEDEVRVFSDLKERDATTGKFYTSFSNEIRLKEIIVGPLCDISEFELKSIAEIYPDKISLIKARLAFGSFRVVKNKRGFNA